MHTHWSFLQGLLNRMEYQNQWSDFIPMVPLCCLGEVMLCCIWFGELFVRWYMSSLLGSYVHQTVILLNYVNDTNLLQWFSWKPKSFYCINSCSYSSVLQSSFSQVAIHLTIISSSSLRSCLLS